MHRPNQSPPPNTSTRPINGNDSFLGDPSSTEHAANQLSAFTSSGQENIPLAGAYHHAAQNWLFPTAGVQPTVPLMQGSSALMPTAVGASQYPAYPMAANYSCPTAEGVFASVNGGHWATAAVGGGGSTASSASANSTSTGSTHNSHQVVDGGDSGDAGRSRRRVLFSATQIRTLERAFTTARFINSATRSRIADEIGLSSTQVKIWYQNRRYKERKIQKDIQHRAKMRLSSISRSQPENCRPPARYSPKRDSTPPPPQLINKRSELSVEVESRDSKEESATLPTPLPPSIPSWPGRHAQSMPNPAHFNALFSQIPPSSWGYSAYPGGSAAMNAAVVGAVGPVGAPPMPPPSYYGLYAAAGWAFPGQMGPAHHGHPLPHQLEANGCALVKEEGK